MASTGWKALRRLPRHPQVDAFLQVSPPEAARTSQRLRDIVHEEVPLVTEAVYYRTPFFFLGGPFCYLSPTKRRVIFGIIDARGIQDATGLLTGTGRSTIRRAAFPPSAKLPEDAVRSWLRQAARRAKDADSAD